MLWIQIFVIGYSFYSVVRYAIRRVGNRGAMAQLRKAPVVRQMSPQERAALQPFLIDRKLEVSPEVRLLHGEFKRHGLQTQSIAAAQHDTLGDVEVLLPYDAQDFLDFDNQAEVAIAGKLAVVLKLNDFDLLGGQERALQHQVGTLPEELAADPAAAHDGADERYRAGELDILGERQATPDEAAALADKEALGGVSALGWLLAFGLLWLATWDSTDAAHPYLLGAGLLLAVGSSWLFLRRRAKPSGPHVIRRVRGQLNSIAVSNSGLPNVRFPALFLGNTIKLQAPLRWHTQINRQVGKVVEAELRPDDSSVIGFGSGWSLADELRRFPPVYWARNLLQVFVALLALLVLWLCAPDLRLEAALTLQRLHMGEPPSYTSAAEVRTQPPGFGQLAQLKGTARCDIAAGAAPSPDAVAWPVANCLTLRWDGEAPQIPDLELPPGLTALYDGRFIEAQLHPREAALRILRENLWQNATNDPLYAYMARQQADRDATMIVTNLRQVVEAVDQACDEGLARCHLVRRKIADALVGELDDGPLLRPPPTWEALQARAAQDTLPPVSLKRSVLVDLWRTARDAVTPALIQRLAQLEPGILASQRGGVVLRFPHSMGAANDPSATDPFGNQTVRPFRPALKRSDEDATLLQAYWPELQKLGTSAAQGPFAFSGIVVAQGTDAAGTPWLEIAPQSLSAASRGWTAVAFTAWWVLALALLLVQSVFFFRHLAHSRRRNQALDEDIQRRPPPGEFSVF